MSGIDPGAPECSSRLCLLCGLAPPVAGGPYTVESSPWCELCRTEIQTGRVTADRRLKEREDLDDRASKGGVL